MTRICSFTIYVAVIGLLALPACFAKDGGLNGKKIASTYLAIQEDGTQIMQINKDGNFSVIYSVQFAGGVTGESFSNTLGSWKKAGELGITATAVNITFENSDGSFTGVAATTLLITFENDFQTANVIECDGAIYPPGVNPFDPDAEPIDGSEFSCAGFEFHRVPSM